MNDDDNDDTEQVSAPEDSNLGIAPSVGETSIARRPHPWDYLDSDSAQDVRAHIKATKAAAEASSADRARIMAARRLARSARRPQPFGLAPGPGGKD